MESTAGTPDTIDRISATLRPPGFPVMKQTWSELLFLLRYILYAASADGLHRARVHHAPYPVQPGVLDRLARESLVAAAGIRRPDTDPLAHYASRLNVEIWPLEDVV